MSAAAVAVPLQLCCRVCRQSCPSSRQPDRDRAEEAGPCREALGTPCRDPTRPGRTMALTDIDDFLMECAQRFARSTVADHRRKRSFVQPVSARHGAHFRRPGRFRNLAGAAKVRTPPPSLAVGGRAAPVARGGHVLRTGPARLCTPADDEHLWPRSRRGDPAASSRTSTGPPARSRWCGQRPAWPSRCRCCRRWPRRWRCTCATAGRGTRRPGTSSCR